MIRFSYYAFIRYIRVTLIILGVFCSGVVFSQRVPGEGGDEVEETRTESFVKKFIDTDSLSVNWHSPQLPNQQFILSDTSHEETYHQYDPARRRHFDWIHLGMPGTASRPVLWMPNFRKGNQPGMESLNSYRMPLRPARIYEPENSFTNLYFLRGADQDDYYFEANFAIQLAGNFNFSLDYERLPQIGEYRSQRLRNTGATFTFSKQFWKDKWTSIFIYSTTELIQENNGGVTTDTLFENPIFQVRANIPVFLDNSQTTLVDKSFSWINRAKLLRIGKLSAYGEYEIRFMSSRFKYYDLNLQAHENTDFYHQYSTFFDKGLRMAYRHRAFMQDLRLGSKIDSLGFLRNMEWRAGVQYNNIKWEPGGETQRFNEVHVYGDAWFDLFGRIKSNLSYQTGLFDAANNTKMVLNGLIKLNRHFYIMGGYERMRNLPSLLERSVRVNFQQVYKKDELADIRINQISGRVGSEKWKNYLGVSYFRVLNWIYFDSQGLPEQLDNTANLLQVFLYQPLRWRVINFDQSVSFQQSDRIQLGAVDFFYKNSLYYQGNLLSKSSKLRIGVDFRYIKPGTPLTYFPLNGQWLVLDDIEMQPFYELDVFASMKVKVFKAFFRFENLINAFTGQVGMLHPRYPMQEAGIRFGVQWMFVN